MTVPTTSTTGPAEQVRLLIADVNPGQQYLTDANVQGFLDLNDGDVRLAAADALEAIATSEALIGKVITTQDLQTDAAKLADTLLKRAAMLRARAREIADQATGDDWAALVVGGIPADPYGRAPELTDRTLSGM